MVEGHKEAQYGQYFDLEMLLEHITEQKKEMDGEEAILRLLYEFSRSG
jgi:hypothetical protein